MPEEQAPGEATGQQQVAATRASDRLPPSWPKVVIRGFGKIQEEGEDDMG